MAGRFIDGFAHYATANIPQKYTNTQGPSTVTIDPSPPAGRVGPALKLAQGAIGKTIDHQTGWTHGFAWYLDAHFFQSEILVWVHAGAQILFRLHLEADGTLSMYAGGGISPGSLIGNSSPFSIHTATWYYIEVQFSLAGTTNIAVTGTMRVNGAQVATGTANSGVNVAGLLLQTATVNGYQIGPNGLGNVFIKDQYVRDNTGPAPFNDFAGDLTFLTVFPDGDVITDWTPSGGGTSFNMINENPPDDDATYVEAVTIGDKDVLTFQDLPVFFGDIAGVQYNVYARKTGEGTKSIKQNVGATGGELLSPEIFLDDNYVYYTFMMDTDPATGMAWTRPNFNAKDFGFEVIK